MGFPKDSCLLTHYPAGISEDGETLIYTVSKLRLKYRVSASTKARLRHFGHKRRELRRIAYWVSQQTLRGVETPEITSETIANAPYPSVEEGLKNYILWLGARQGDDTSIVVDDSKNEAGKVAICAASDGDASYLIETLWNERAIEAIRTAHLGNPTGLIDLKLSTYGWQRFEQIKKEAGI